MGVLQVPKSLSVRLHLVTVLNGSGYGLVGLNLLRALEGAGQEVCLFPRPQDGFPLQLSIDDVVLVRSAIARQQFFDLNAPCVRLASEFDMGLFAGRGPHCGLSFFETNSFTRRERHHLGSLDLLLVPSGWAEDVACREGVAARVAVVPMGVDRNLFHEGSAARAEGPTRFLHVGKWERRKGQDVLLRAFECAFEPGDPVRLSLMCHNPFLGDRNEEWMAEVRRSPMAAHIEFLPRVSGLEELAQTMRSCDCGVFPSRAEGWNLELLEMMSCGKAVIATNYSAHTEFAKVDNCRLVDVDSLERASDPRWMTLYSKQKTGEWAHLGDAQLEQLVEHLRDVHRLAQAGQLGVNEAGIETARRFSWYKSAVALIRALERVC